MKRFLANLLKGSFGRAESSYRAQLDAPAAGEVYAFRTRPYSEFAPSETGRYAAFKILGVDGRLVVMAVLDGIWPMIPDLSEVRKTSVTDEHRLNHDGKAAVFGVQHAWWRPGTDLQEAEFVGILGLSAAERSHVDAMARFAVGTRHATIHAADYVAEGEWRWSNDREAFVAEIQLRDAKNEAERAAKERRYRTRLSKLTWEQLLSETPFGRWSPSPPFPPEGFINAARATIRDACLSLRELGAKPRRADVRAILKKTVQWFNDADEKAGGVIETDEREDIYAVLEEMAYVARQKVLAEEIDEWREW